MISPLLKTFLVVANKGSYGKAAPYLHMTSSAIKKHIDLLEDQIGFKLFIKDVHGAKLTNVGEEFYSHVKKTDEDFNAFLAGLHRKYNNTLQSVRIGNPLFEDNSIRNLIFSKLKNNGQRIEVSFVPFIGIHNYTQELIDHLYAEYDCFISPRCHILDQQLSYVPLQSFQACIIVKANNKLSNQSSVSLKDLNDQNIYLCKSGTFPIGESLRRDLEKQLSQPNIIEFDIDNYLDFYSTFDDDNGVLISFTAWNAISNSVNVVTLDGYFIECGLYYPHDLSPVLTDFLTDFQR